MKSSFILAFACSFLATNCLTQAIELKENQKYKLQSYLQECFIQENASAEDVNKILKWDIENPSEKMKCVSACFFEKFGALKDNKVQEDVVAQKLEPIINAKRTGELVEKCKDITGADRCDMGFKIFECLWNYKDF